MIGEAIGASVADATLRSVTADARLVTAFHPLALPLVVGALAREAGLPWPVKLALRAGEAGLLAEVPRLLERRACEAIAIAAVDAALAWLVGGGRPGSAEGRAEADAGERGRAAAASLRFRCEPAEDGALRVHATPAAGPPARVSVTACAEEALLVASTTSVRPRAGRAERAIALFCLEASARLRRVRVAAAPGKGAVRVAWEIAVPAVLPEPALAEAIEWVAVARAEMSRAVAALAEPEVSDAYLALHRAAPGARGERAGPRPAQAGAASPRPALEER